MYLNLINEAALNHYVTKTIISEKSKRHIFETEIIYSISNLKIIKNEEQINLLLNQFTFLKNVYSNN